MVTSPTTPESPGGETEPYASNSAEKLRRTSCVEIRVSEMLSRPALMMTPLAVRAVASRVPVTPLVRASAPNARAAPRLRRADLPRRSGPAPKSDSAAPASLRGLGVRLLDGAGMLNGTFLSTTRSANCCTTAQESACANGFRWYIADGWSAFAGRSRHRRPYSTTPHTAPSPHSAAHIPVIAEPPERTATPTQLPSTPAAPDLRAKARPTNVIRKAPN